VIRDLIVGVGSGSYGSGQLGARGGGAATPATKSHGGAARGSPDFTVNGAPGVNKARVCVREGQCDMGNPPRALTGLGKARGRGYDGGGRSARLCMPARAVPA
jgi:hypothetical protein